MQAVTYSKARTHFAAMLDKVNDDHAPVLIARQHGKLAVLMSLEDFSSWEETAYLLRSPANARRLKGAIDRLNQGHGIARDVSDLADD
jgi:antitoxin YefM